ncbi:MAG: hypothetical protein ACI30N_03555 [Muribaculaceae bacterium]
MEKLIQILVSSLVVLCYCSQKICKKNVDSDVCMMPEYRMENSISGFELMMPDALDSILKTHVDNYIVDDFQHGEGIYVSNFSDTEFAFLRLNCGGKGLQFDAIILTDTMPLEFWSDRLRSEIPQFVTSGGAYLGMTKSDYVRIYPNNNISYNDKSSMYVQYDTINLLYNKFYFRNDRLRKVEIGYDW